MYVFEIQAVTKDGAVVAQQRFESEDRYSNAAYDLADKLCYRDLPGVAATRIYRDGEEISAHVYTDTVDVPLKGTPLVNGLTVTGLRASYDRYSPELSGIEVDFAESVIDKFEDEALIDAIAAMAAEHGIRLEFGKLFCPCELVDRDNTLQFFVSEVDED